MVTVNAVCRGTGVNRDKKLTLVFSQFFQQTLEKTPLYQGQLLQVRFGGTVFVSQDAQRFAVCDAHLLQHLHRAFVKTLVLAEVFKIALLHPGNTHTYACRNYHM